MDEEGPEGGRQGEWGGDGQQGEEGGEIAQVATACCGVCVSSSVSWFVEITKEFGDESSVFDDVSRRVFWRWLGAVRLVHGSPT